MYVCVFFNFFVLFVLSEASLVVGSMLWVFLKIGE